MPRQSHDDKLAALEKQKAEIRAKQVALARKIRAVRSKQRNQAERTRAHMAIVVGLGLIEHATRNPSSEVRRVIGRIVENHLAKRPEDRPAFAELLDKLATVPEAAE